MDRQSMLMKEYQNLRDEIMQQISLHNTLLTFTITATIAILSFIFAQDKILPYLFLFPYCIIIPMSMRIAYYRIQMAKLSAYLIVYIESEISSINWETRNMNAIKDISNANRKGHLKRFTIIRYYECLLLCVLCYVLFIVYYIHGIHEYCSWLNIINILWPVIFLIYECFITKQIRSVHKERERWIKIWANQKYTSESSCIFHRISTIDSHQ